MIIAANHTAEMPDELSVVGVAVEVAVLVGVAVGAVEAAIAVGDEDGETVGVAPEYRPIILIVTGVG